MGELQRQGAPRMRSWWLPFLFLGTSASKGQEPTPGPPQTRGRHGKNGNHGKTRPGHHAYRSSAPLLGQSCATALTASLKFLITISLANEPKSHTTPSPFFATAAHATPGTPPRLPPRHLARPRHRNRQTSIAIALSLFPCPSATGPGARARSHHPRNLWRFRLGGHPDRQSSDVTLLLPQSRRIAAIAISPSPDRPTA